MRKSRTETAETRERILSTASRLFLTQGLATVGMRDIMAAANLTQGGFYRHFDSRDQLIAEAVRSTFDRLLLNLETEIAGKAPAAAVQRVVHLYLAQTTNHACPLAMLGTELSHASPQVRSVAADGHRRLIQLLATHLTALSRPSAKAVAGSIVSTMLGAVTLANIAPDKPTAEATLRNARAAIQSLLNAA